MSDRTPIELAKFSEYDESPIAPWFASECRDVAVDHNALLSELRYLRESLLPKLVEKFEECISEFEYAAQYKGEYLSNKHCDAEFAKACREMLVLAAPFVAGERKEG